jgi:phosphoglycolate phosphatase-like HAD superfamily hydrolase
MIRAVLLDFDGVILESVAYKTRAFEALFAGEAPEVREAIVRYHLRHGGVSRYEKFRHIYANILGRPLPAERLAALSRDFSRLVVDQVAAAEWVPGARRFIRRNHRRRDLFVVSGTPGAELRAIVARRGLAACFRGIFGSPDPKPVLIRRILRKGSYRPSEAVLVGDAETDLDAARETGIFFVARTGPVFRGGGGFRLPDLRALEAVLRCLDEESGEPAGGDWG